jgi:cytochrome c553
MRTIVPILTLAAMALPAAALADHPGEAKAEICLDCHEPSEDFAGMSAEEIEAKIRGAQAGEWKHKDVIKELPQEDISDVAAWFAAEAAE